MTTVSLQALTILLQFVFELFEALALGLRAGLEEIQEAAQADRGIDQETAAAAQGRVHRREGEGQRAAAHPQGEGTLFRINDTFSASDHMDAGAALLMEMLTLKSYGAYFNWLCEGSTTGIKTMEDVRCKMEDVWYTLDGRRLSGKPSQKGIYIYKGKKVCI